VAGAAQLLVGHPFDTIKVKLQSQPALAPGAAPVYSGALDATRRTLAAEGMRGLYRRASNSLYTWCNSYASMSVQCWRPPGP